MIDIKVVSSKKELKQFIDFPFLLYKNEPNWVGELKIQTKALLDKNKNPFFEHSDAEYFLALRDGKVVGRVAAIVNYNHNKIHNEKVVFFGFYDVIDDLEVSRNLLNKVIEFGKEKGMEILRGPMNPSTNDTCAMLYEGYDMPNVIMMPYNYPYYNEHMKKLEMEKAMDLLSYHFDATQGMPKKLERVASVLTRRNKYSLKFIDKKNVNKMLDDVKEVYNKAWEANWGFIPMTEKELEHMKEELKSILEPSLAFVVYDKDRPVGFSLTLLDINQITKSLNGKLFPFGVFKLMKDWKKITCARNITMGVVPDYRKRGIETIMIYHTIKNSIKLGITDGDLGWILEINELMRRELVNIGAKVYKRYRIYEKKI